MKMLVHLIALTFVASLTIGCEEPALPKSKSTATTEAAPAEKEPPMVAGAPGRELPEDEIPITDIPRKFTHLDPIRGRRSRRVAQEGNTLGLGTIGAAGAYGSVQPLIQAIDYAHELYWPQNNFEYAKTQEEFWEKVLEPALNEVPLPEIPEYAEYCYVPSQPKAGLQIRLKPGGPRSKVPAGTSPEEAIKMLAGEEGSTEATAGAPPAEQPPAEQGDEQPADPATAATPEPESGRDEAGNPLDLRERAAGIGGPVLDLE